MNNDLIPGKHKGKNTEFSHSVQPGSEEAAKDCFRRAAKRLLNPPVWHELAGALSASFTLTGEQGDAVERLAQEHDHICIDIPGPGNAAGHGNDWVKIEQIDDHTNEQAFTESIGMKLRACANPKQQEINTIAHFFTDAATSTFLITRTGNEVTAHYFGRNETPNTDTGNTGNNVRNAIVAAGASAGLSELQWSALINAFLQPEIGG